MLLTANNHCYDYGTQGLQRTLEVVKSYNLDTLGVTAAAEETKYRVVDLNGIKVGMVNYTYAEINEDRNLPAINGLPTDKKAAGLINAFDYDNTDMFYAEMENHISGMQAAGAEAIILYIHWGDEFSVATTNSQRAIAQKLCDMGVDIIAGSHPHVIEPIQLLTSADGSRQTVCLYSMGNFVSNQRADNIALTTGHSEDSVMLQVTFVEYSNGEVHVEAVDLIPTWMLIRGSGDSRKYYVLPLDEAVSDWKGTYELSKEQLADAESSLKRTNALVQSDLTAIQSALDNQTAARNQAYGIFNGGVG
jgi:poly-gamma-glutamate synthesis protein (capsule biosynthesis protein)